MRAGWSDKDAAVVLGIKPTKVSQAMTPAIRKVALLALANPTATLRDVLDAMDTIQAEREPMTDHEWERRYRFQTGRGPTRHVAQGVTE